MLCKCCLHIEQTLKQANAQTNQRNDHEHQQNRSLHDGRTDLSGPAHSTGENITNVANQTGDGNSRLSSTAKPPFSMNQYLDCLTNEAQANKTE